MQGARHSENLHLRNPAFIYAERPPFFQETSMHFDLADLRLFIHIGESPSLTQGARRAFLSPAAASARIKRWRVNSIRACCTETAVALN